MGDKLLSSYDSIDDDMENFGVDDMAAVQAAQIPLAVAYNDDVDDALTGSRWMSKEMAQWALMFMYTITGVMYPMLIEVLTYNGACEKSTFLFILPTYVGMMFSFLSNIESLRTGKVRWARMTAVILIDLCSGILCFTGLVSAGSAIFTVVYSSVTAWTAVFSWLFFGRELHYMQWSGVCLVMLGLVGSSLGSGSFGATDSEDVGIGILMILVGSMFHSLYYIVSESILKDDNPIAPEFLGSFQGLFGTVVFGLWQLLYTAPRWDVLITDEIAAHHGSVTQICVAYAGLIVVNFVHGVCLFHMLKTVGSTTTGVLKGIISVLVFVFSHYAFCSLQQSQCFNYAKGASLAVVVVGVLCYSVYKVDVTSVPAELRPKPKDLLSKASAVWLHRGVSREELAALNRSNSGTGYKMKRVNSKTVIPFESRSRSRSNSKLSNQNLAVAALDGYE
jgi:drug/metabolite transporter (DMT)-like permease